MGFECEFVYVEDGIPKDFATWHYMGNNVARIFLEGNIGVVVHEVRGLTVKRITMRDYNIAVKEYQEWSGLDAEEIFYVDFSLPGDWFIVIMG